MIALRSIEGFSSLLSQAIFNFIMLPTVGGVDKSYGIAPGIQHNGKLYDEICYSTASWQKRFEHNA
jgi:hypothetical protein